MARRSLPIAAILCLGAIVSGCGFSTSPPPELHGLWSAGQAACAAGVGVHFGSDAIQAVYEQERQTLFEHPRYQVLGEGEAFRVRILYDLPERPGGAHVAGARGVLVLMRDGRGGIVPEAHNLIDGRTGAARVQLDNDPALSVLSLQPCGDDHPFREGLRGREHA
jgi:hypothetical protein